MLKAKYEVTIRTKRFLRKPKIEKFKGAWRSETEVKMLVVKYRPRAEILKIELLE